MEVLGALSAASHACSSDVGPLSEVVELVIARRMSIFLSSGSHIERFHIVRSAANPQKAVTALRATPQVMKWMDCSPVSSSHGTSRSAAATVVVCCTKATSRASMSGRAVRVWLDLCALTVGARVCPMAEIEHHGARCASSVACRATRNHYMYSLSIVYKL